MTMTPLDLEIAIDRRRLKRRVAVWRTATVLITLAAALIIAGKLGIFDHGDHVAQLNVEGLIIFNPDITAALRTVKNDETAQALIVNINSPGGTTVGGEEMYEALRQVASEKPVVAVIGTLGTSAGYLVALAADHIITRNSSLTGSIGVMIQTAEMSQLLDDIGIQTEVIRSSPLKGQPSLSEPMNNLARTVNQRLVDDVFMWFVDRLVERRNMNRAKAIKLADGRVYTGRQALALNLTDKIGGDLMARQWLETEHGVPKSLPVRDIDQIGATETIIRQTLGFARKALFSERVMLDGLVSVWHPQGSR